MQGGNAQSVLYRCCGIDQDRELARRAGQLDMFDFLSAYRLACLGGFAARAIEVRALPAINVPVRRVPDASSAA